MKEVLFLLTDKKPVVSHMVALFGLTAKKFKSKLVPKDQARKNVTHFWSQLSEYLVDYFYWMHFNCYENITIVYGGIQFYCFVY